MPAQATQIITDDESRNERRKKILKKLLGRAISASVQDNQEKYRRVLAQLYHLLNKWNISIADIQETKVDK